MSRSKEEIISRMNEIGVSRRVCTGRCPNFRAVNSGEIDAEKRMVPFILVSDNNAGERYDWWNDEVFIEELDVSGANLRELRTMFKDHNPSVDTAVARIDNARVDGNQIKADAYFSSDQSSDTIFQKYADGILTDVSIGYRVNDVIITESKGEPTHVLVTDFDIVELSAVWKGFDPGAKVGRSEPQGADSSILKKRFHHMKEMRK